MSLLILAMASYAYVYTSAYITDPISHIMN